MLHLFIYLWMVKCKSCLWYLCLFVYCATFGCISAPFSCLNSKEPEGSSLLYCSLLPPLLNCPTIPVKVVLTPDPFCFRWTFCPLPSSIAIKSGYLWPAQAINVGQMVSFCVKALTFSFFTAAMDRSTPAITELPYCTHSYLLHNFCQYFQAILRFEPQLEDLMIISSSSSCLLLLHTPADASAAPPGYSAANARKRFTLQGLSNRRSLPAGNSSAAHVSPHPPHHLLPLCPIVLLSVALTNTI